MCNLDTKESSSFCFFFPFIIYGCCCSLWLVSGLCLLRFVRFTEILKKIHIWSMKHVHEELAFIIKCLLKKLSLLVLVWCRKDASSSPQLCSLCFRFLRSLHLVLIDDLPFYWVISLMMYEIVSVIHVRFSTLSLLFWDKTWDLILFWSTTLVDLICWTESIGLYLIFSVTFFIYIWMFFFLLDKIVVLVAL